MKRAASCLKLTQSTRRSWSASLLPLLPLTFPLLIPQLLRNFVYRRFHAADGVIDSLRFVFSRDLVISAVRTPLHAAC